MKKTFVAGALAFTMAAAFLSGCGSNTQTKAANRLEEITLKLLPNLISHQMNLLILPRVVMSSMWEVILRWRNTSQINLVWS